MGEKVSVFIHIELIQKVCHPRLLVGRSRNEFGMTATMIVL